jgi:MHS family proline/betaine transporter-like MFS transporter
VLKYTDKQAHLVSTCSMVLLMFLVVPTAALSDRIGRKRLLMAVCVVYMVTSYPIFWLMTQPGLASAFTALMLMTTVLGFYIGAAPTVFVELFPTSVRYTGLSLSYNICAAAFGGTAPMFCAWLIEKTHMITIPALYIILCAALSFIAFIGYHDRYKEELL